MKKIFIILILTLSIFGISQIVHAGPLDQATKNLSNAVGGTGLSNDVGTSIGIVVKALLSVVGTIFLILTIYAGILWMTAQGNTEKVEQSQGIIRSAVIGLFVVMAAYAITAFVTSKVGGATSGGSGNGNACAGICASADDCSKANSVASPFHIDSTGVCSNQSDVCCVKG
jgi:hypothetical protein